jgi:Asp-tRNA(Asn)/Glu-tRNA(Gln) amidotransferase A subunit family amidase
MKRMSVRLPSLEQIEQLGAGFGLVLTFDETTAFQQAFKGSLVLRQTYGDALKDVDVQATPMIPSTATPIPPADAPLGEFIDTGLIMQANTCPFDVSGHPAFRVPCGLEDGLPVGLTLVGRHFDEATLGSACPDHEARGDWKKRKSKSKRKQ